MNRSQAIATLKSNGFNATERRWALGDTIRVTAVPIQHGKISAFAVMMYLVPTSGEGWCAHNPMPREAEERHFRTLEEAVSEITSMMLDAIAKISN
jgi:hypothetical protein